MWDVVGNVASSLALVALIVGAAVAIYKHRVEKMTEAIKSTRPADRLRGLNLAQGHIRVDLSQLPREDRARVAEKELHVLSELQRRWQFISALAILTFAVVAIVAMFADKVQ